MNDGAGCRQRPRRMWSPGTVLFAIVVCTTLVTAACDGASNSLPVASSGTSSGNGSGNPGSSGGTASSGNSASSRNSTTGPSTGTAARLLDEWTACMRSHGDPGQATPTIDAYDAIHITISLSVQGGWQGYNGQNGYGGPGAHCLTYIDEAERALGGGPGTVKIPDQAMVLRYTQCMRANGVPDYTPPFPGAGMPGPGGGSGSNLNAPVYLKATKTCFNETHVHVPGGIPPPGAVEVNGLGWIAGA